MSKDIFKTKSFLFLSAFIFLILAVLIVVIFREEPDISEITGSPSALFSLNRGASDNPDNPFTRPDSDNLPVTTMNSGDPDEEQPEHRPGTLVSDANAGRGVITEAPVEPTPPDQPSAPVDNPEQPDNGQAAPTDNDQPDGGAATADNPPATTPETPPDNPGAPEGDDQPGQPVELTTEHPVDPTGLSIPSVLPAGAILSTATQDSASGNVATKVELAVGGGAVVLRIEGNRPISAKAFTLSEPERVVVDLSGSWKVALPSVPANNLVGTMRQGIQPDATRLVLDMRNKPQSVLLEQLGTNVVELRIQ